MRHSLYSGSRLGVTKRQISGAFIALLAVWAVPVWSAVVTLHETRVDEIFSQAIFNGAQTGPIDVRFSSTLELVAAQFEETDSSDPDFGLITIDGPTGAEFNSLNNLVRNAFPTLPDSTIPLFFVDKVNWCGGTPAAGCANTLIAVLNSTTTTGSVGDELTAHEIGHVLSLNHPNPTVTNFSPGNDDPTNLMHSNIGNDKDTLLAEQIDIIFNSSWIQGNKADGFFIDIAPVLVVAAAAVPLPAPLVLLLGGLVPLLARRRTSA